MEKEMKIKNGAPEVLEALKKASDRNPSATYTIKSFKGNIKKMEVLKMCTPKELEQLKEIHKAIVQRWIAMDMEF